MRWPFSSAISRYLVSDRPQRPALGWTAPGGFHPLYRGTWYLTLTLAWKRASGWEGFHPLYRGTWYLTVTPMYAEIGGGVSIRYIAVLGFQLMRGIFICLAKFSFHPLYRGTWFPTLPEKHPL